MGEHSFELTEDDLVAAYWLNWKLTFRRWDWSMVVLAISAAGLCGWLWWRNPDAAWWHYAAVVVGLLGLYALLCASSWPVFKRIARRSWSQTHRIWGRQRVEYSPDGIAFSSERGGFRLRWDEVFSWAGDERTLLLSISSIETFVVPWSAFAPDARKEIVDHLTAAGVKER